MGIVQWMIINIYALGISPFRCMELGRALCQSPTVVFFVVFDSLRPINNISLNRDGSSWVDHLSMSDLIVYHGSDSGVFVHIISLVRVPTCQGKVREIWFFFKVREKSGNSVKWSGKLENLQKSGKSQGVLKSYCVNHAKIEQTDMRWWLQQF